MHNKNQNFMQNSTKIYKINQLAEIASTFNKGLANKIRSSFAQNEVVTQSVNHVVACSN